MVHDTISDVPSQKVLEDVECRVAKIRGSQIRRTSVQELSGYQGSWHERLVLESQGRGQADTRNNSTNNRPTQDLPLRWP